MNKTLPCRIDETVSNIAFMPLNPVENASEEIMNIVYEEQLITYMNSRGKRNILVDIASSNTSDFDVTELYLRFISDKHADRLLGEGKGYRAEKAPVGRVIFPPYHMHIADTVRLSLGSFLFIKWIKQEGLKL